MTQKERKEYKQKQYQIRYEIDQGICQYKDCNTRSNIMAHRIAQSKANIKKYGWEIIQHNFNIAIACLQEFGGHNDSFNIGNKPKQCEKLVELIKNRGDERLSTTYINNYIKE